MSKFPHIFSPYTIKNTVFKNRIFASPVSANLWAHNGAPTREGIFVYENRARGGFAQVTVTETFVEFDFGARHDHGIDLVSPDLPKRNLELIHSLAQAIKSHGAIASIQFNHVGNTNHPNCSGGKNPIGPSAFIRADGVEVTEMDETMIHLTADKYANACAMAKALGFDMVMLHGGHGWLLSQFTSPLSNKRKDKWGGDLENRARFALLVLEKVRVAVGNDFPVEYRISGDERVEGGMHLAETTEFCKMIEDKVDLIHVTSGIYHSHVETKAFSSMFDDHGCNIDLAMSVKEAVNIPVVAVGGFNDPALAEQCLAEGKCDFVALGRQQLADPYWVKKALMGQDDEIAPCLRCSCFNPLSPDNKKRPLVDLYSCTVNPRSGREYRLALAPRPQSAKTVFVVGGGVAGMYAAITSAERGHNVTLLEKNNYLGGLLIFSEIDFHKADLKRYKNSLIVRLKKSGVRIQLNTCVTKDVIKQKKPDAVICAIGSEPIVPDIAGIESAYNIMEAYASLERLGQKVVIIGGGLVGCETGLFFADLGKSVHIVEMRDDVAPDGRDSHRRALIPLMKRSLTYNVGQACSEINEDGITIINKEKVKQKIVADSVIYAVGMKPLAPEVASLRQSTDYFVAVGDCVQPRNVEKAVYEGFMAAMDIL